MEDPVSIEFLRQVVSYDPKSGELRWKERPLESFARETDLKIWNARRLGKIAFDTKTDEGYKHGGFMYKMHKAHRVAWAIHYGEWPKGHIDHINGNKTDNRIENLRVVTDNENAKNQPLSPRNKSGVPGVLFREKTGLWHASIGKDGKLKHLGNFPNKDDAIAARRKAERELGFHENHGRRAAA